MVEFRPLIAPLFVPANRPERIGKAAACGADAIIVDLEDSVPPHEKDQAREDIADELDCLPVPVWLRINARGTDWFESDLCLASSVGVAGIMLPKTETANDLVTVANHLGQNFPIVALVETAIGLANLSKTATAKNLVQIAFGSIDYALDLNCSEDKIALSHARAEIVFRSRVAELPAPLDGVTTSLTDESILEADCANAVSFGFGGKLAIHPNQITTIRTQFLPSPQTLDWARRVLQAEAGANGAAVQVDGRMVDRPIAEKARRILAMHG